ncbi:NINE protein [Agromyces sp. Root1464]|uniref:NINE protein n=1 Tax=Agromyces sp. Root1464 TaxID=1736467 RepID=UPI0009EBE282|nr:NINE protein [Agromyces sp. Root1464]
MSLEAGWYDDESDTALLRYWDGTAWTPHTAAKAADAAPNPLPAPSPSPGAALTPPAAPGAPFAPSTASTPLGGPPIPAFGAAPAFDDIDESTTARPMGSPAPQPPAAAAPPAAPAYPIAAPGAFPPPPAAPSEFPSYTLPAPPGYAPLQEQTTAPLPPGYAAAPGPQFSYEPYRTTGRTFVATWLFALLLGFWGADRFYLGKIGTAIAKLLTLGGLGVWVLVDLLLVLTGSQRDREGRELEGYHEHKRTAWIVTGGLVALSVISSLVANVAGLLVR